MSIDSRQTGQLDWRDPFDGNYLSDVDYQSCTVQKSDGVEEVSLSPLVLPYITGFRN